MESGGVVQVLDVAQAVNGRHYTTGPRGDDGLLEAQPPFAGLQFVGTDESSRTAKKLDLVLPLFQRALDAVVDAGHDRILALDSGFEPEANVAIDLNAKLGRPVGNQVHHLGRAQHGLGGHAALIHSSAANLCSLDQRHP